MEQNAGSDSFFGKFMGGMFVAIIAPTLTGVAVWFIQKKLDEPPPQAPAAAPPPAAAPATPGAVAVAKVEAKTALEPAKPTPANSESRPTPPPSPPPAAKVVEKEAAKPAPALASTASTAGTLPTASRSSTAGATPPVVKTKKAAIRGRLFNGVDLTGFDSYLGIPYSGASKPPYGLNNDPEGVFTVQDGELHISGKVFGGLISTREYENYHLVVEYKWGEKKWPPRNDVPRIGGIVLHATGEPGAVHGWSVAGITCVLAETSAGGLLLADGLPRPITLYAEAERRVFKKAGSVLIYKPGEPLVPVHAGYVHALGWRPPLLAAKVPVKDIAHPVGEWNRLECLCEGDRITVILNGTTVNAASRVSQAKGKLFIESQGAEIFFRTINVRPAAAAAPPVPTPAKPRGRSG
jgi:hypothetical protein